MSLKNILYLSIGLVLGGTFISYGARIADNILDIGDNADTDKIIRAKNGDTNLPQLKYDSATSMWMFSNNGTVFVDIGSGSGSAAVIGSENLLTGDDTTCNDTVGNWTASGGSLTHNTANPGFGAGSCSWDSSGTQTLDSNSTFETPTDGMIARQCMAQISYSWVGTVTELALQVQEDGDGLIAALDLTPTASGEWRKTTVSFECVSGKTYKVRINSTVDADLILYDEIWLGNDLQEIQFTTEALIVEMRNVGVAGCDTSAINTTGFSDFGTFVEDTDCIGPEILFNSGIADPQTTDVDRPHFTVNNLPAGLYRAEMYGALVDLSAGGSAHLRISDGTNNGAPAAGGSNAGGNVISQGQMTMVVEYTASGNRTFKMQGAVNTGDLEWKANNAPLTDLHFALYKLPTAKELALKLDNQSKTRILRAEHFANGQICEWDINTQSFASFITDDSHCQFRELENQNMGSVVSKSNCTNLCPGLIWTPPKAGSYMVCFNMSWRMNATNIGTYRLRDSTNSVTLNQQHFRSSLTNDNLQGELCGTVNLNSVVPITLEIQVVTDADSFSIRNDFFQGLDIPVITWLIYPLSENGTQIVRIEQNKLTANNTAGGRMCNVRVNNSGVPAENQDENNCVSSIDDNGTGLAQLNFTTDYWLSGGGGPVCTVSAQDETSVAENVCYLDGNPGTTSMAVRCYQTTDDANVDEDFHVLCFGRGGLGGLQ